VNTCKDNMKLNNKKSEVDRIAILISSYDVAEDLWLPLHQSYEKYWPDNPFKIYLATNRKKPLLPNFNILSIGDEDSWSDNILKCIDMIDEEYILLTFDDLFLHSKIDNDSVINYAEQIVKNKWSYLRLNNANMSMTESIEIIPPDISYRASTVWAIFDKKVFKDLLIRTESAWDFEIIGSKRSNKYTNFFCTNEVVIPYLNAVVKGKFVPKIFKHLQDDGFDVTRNNIKEMSIFSVIVNHTINLRSRLFRRLVPESQQLRVRNLFHKY